VMDVDVTRQRISLTMRLDDTAGTLSRSGGAASGPRDPRPSEPKRAPESKPQPGGAIALALERAKRKK
jgi:uncharacterized protein